MTSALKPFRRMFDYSGRSSKKEFFSFFWVFLFAIPVGFAVIYPATQDFDPVRHSADWALIAFGVYIVPVLFVTVPLFVRRFHDFDYSGWWILWLLLPVVGDLAVLGAAAWVDGTIGPNRFGPDPRIKEQPDKRLRQLGY